MLRRMMHHYRRSFVALLSVVVLVLLTTGNTLAATNRYRVAGLVGPKSHYLALGNSLSFGYQPDLNYDDGYADDFAANLRQYGSQYYANMGCPGETSTSMITGKCPVPFLRKFPYLGSQLTAAVDYLKIFAGKVSPVTLDIGANDLLPDINTSTCTISPNWASDLATVDYNLTHTILPQLHAALTINGTVTGDLLLMNYYDPYQNECPQSVPYLQEVNQHLAADATGYATVVDVFSAFGGATTPNPTLCHNTWICSLFKDVHATTAGYSVIANAFEKTAGY